MLKKDNKTKSSDSPLPSPYVTLFRLHRKRSAAEEKLALLKTAYTIKLKNKLSANNSVDQSQNRKMEPKVHLPVPSHFESAALKAALDILERLVVRDNLKLFVAPVNAYFYNTPDYYKVITEPLDLGTIKTRLLCGQYTSAFLALEKEKKVWSEENPFVKDVQLVWQNALKYNGANSEVGKEATALRKVFEGLLSVQRLETLSPETESVSTVEKKETLDRLSYSEEELYIVQKIKNDFFKLPSAKKANVLQFMTDKGMPEILVDENAKLLSSLHLEDLSTFMKEMLLEKEDTEDVNTNVSFLEQKPVEQKKIKVEDKKEAEVSSMEDFFTDSENSE